MAKLVEMKNIGITVTSLSEISARISAVSDNDYKEYCANILKFQPVLLKGENVCLQNIGYYSHIGVHNFQ